MLACSVPEGEDLWRVVFVCCVFMRGVFVWCCLCCLLRFLLRVFEVCLLCVWVWMFVSVLLFVVCFCVLLFAGLHLRYQLPVRSNPITRHNREQEQRNTLRNVI